MLAVALVLALVVIVLLCLVWLRVAGNVGPLDLEDYARRNHVVFIPVSEQLALQLEEGPSKPCTIQLDRHRHPLLAELKVSLLS